MIFDTHAHYDHNQFREDRDEILSALPGAGVGLVVNPGCNLDSSKMALELSARYDWIYAAIGIHPEDCADTDENMLSELEKLYSRPGKAKIVAVGEIGLDYYRKENPGKDLQKFVFRRQIEMALKYHLPVIIHDREAHGDCMSIIREYPDLKGVFHCYSGSAEMAMELTRRGWYFGFDGPITYKNARRAMEAAEIIPLDRIVIETDSPYLSPVPFRGKRNDSRNLKYIIHQLAEWKNITPEEMEKITCENGKRLFQIA